MDVIAPRKTRNSRWDRKPVFADGAQPAVAHLTGRDIEIFKCLARHQYLPSDYIHAFVRGDYKSLIHRLNLLSRKPNLYIHRPHQQREHAEANYRKLVYELDNRGAQELRDRDIRVSKKKDHRNFAHELMVCQITASIELGAIADPRNSGSSAGPRSWQATSSPTRPVGLLILSAFRLAIIAKYRTENQLLSSASSKSTTFIFLVQESDCGTEPIDATDNDRSSIRRMFEDYLTIIEQRTYQTHFGANTFMVAIVTTNATRMNPGQSAKRFLFKHIPVFTSSKPSAPATGHILTDPWKRAGFPDFYLNKE